MAWCKQNIPQTSYRIHAPNQLPDKQNNLILITLAQVQQKLIQNCTERALQDNTTEL